MIYNHQKVIWLRTVATDSQIGDILKQRDTTLQRIIDAVRIAEQYGSIDGAHHKQWVVDQMLRVLLGDRYDEWLRRQNDDPNYGEWDTGIAP